MNAFNEKLLNMKSAEVEERGRRDSHVILLRFQGETTREMPVMPRHYNSTVKALKIEVLNFLAKNRNKNAYKDFVFMCGEYLMANNRIKMWHYPFRYYTITIRPSLTGGARPKTVKNPQMVKEKAQKAKVKADELNSELSKSFDKNSANQTENVLAQKVDWFVQKSLQVDTGAQEAFTEALQSLDIETLNLILSQSGGDGGYEMNLKKIAHNIFGKEAQELNKKVRLHTKMLDTATAYIIFAFAQGNLNMRAWHLQAIPEIDPEVGVGTSRWFAS